MEFVQKFFKPVSLSSIKEVDIAASTDAPIESPKITDVQPLPSDTLNSAPEEPKVTEPVKVETTEEVLEVDEEKIQEEEAVVAETLKDAQPDPRFIALDQLNTHEKEGKINGLILKKLFKVVIDDTLYEISCVMDYVEYLKEQIKRLELIQSYQRKADNSNKEKTKDYYHEGMTLLFQQGENMENYSQILEEYKTALKVRENVIDQLYNEIKIIKKLKI